MAYKISGRVKEIGPAQQLMSKGGVAYTKRDLVITVRKFDPYTGKPTDDEGNTPKFTMFGDRCRDLDSVSAGQVVTVHFEVTGRSYDKDGKTDYFTEVRPLRVEAQVNPIFREPMAAVDSLTGGQKVSIAELMEEKAVEEPESGKAAEDDDLPF